MRVLRGGRGGGRGGPTVLLLHGLGATADVWEGVATRLPGAWIAPDLPGHGGTPPLPAYTFADVAAAVAGLVEPEGTVVVGHSFGGVVALHLATEAGVRSVVGIGIKVGWSADELARAAAMAARPPAVFATREEAVARYLRVAGLQMLVEPGTVEAGVVRAEEGWRLALDPRAFGIGEPGMAALVAGAGVPVVLARGERDPMVTREELAALVPEPVELAGLGHNAHVEGPAAVAALVLD